MAQAPGLGGLALGLIPFEQDGLFPTAMDVRRGEVTQALMVSTVIVVFDEGSNLLFKVAGRVIVFEQGAVFQRSVPAFDLALGFSNFYS